MLGLSYFARITHAPFSRYEGKLYKAPKQKMKRNPQEIWNEVVEAAAGDALSAPKSIQHIIGNMASYGNGEKPLFFLRPRFFQGLHA